MSAFVVSKVHVDLLVRAALEAKEHGSPFQWWRVDGSGKYEGWRRLDPLAEGLDDESEHPAEYMVRCSPSAAGQLLVSENVRSVHHRYPGDDVDAGELPGPCDAFYMGPYVYEDPGYTMSPGEVFKAIDCLDYQSCEHEGWTTSEAFSFLRSLRDAYCRRVDGYEAAPWGWESSSLAERV